MGKVLRIAARIAIKFRIVPELIRARLRQSGFCPGDAANQRLGGFIARHPVLARSQSVTLFPIENKKI